MGTTGEAGGIAIAGDLAEVGEAVVEWRRTCALRATFQLASLRDLSFERGPTPRCHLGQHLSARSVSKLLYQWYFRHKPSDRHPCRRFIKAKRKSALILASARVRERARARTSRDDDPRACKGHGAAARSEPGRARYSYGLCIVR